MAYRRTPAVVERLRARRRAIVEAAMAAWAEDPATGMARIARRAGLSVGGLYGHFAGREALWIAVADALAAEAVEAGAPRLPRVPEGLPRLAVGLDEALQVFDRRAPLVRTLLDEIPARRRVEARLAEALRLFLRRNPQLDRRALRPIEAAAAMGLLSAWVDAVLRPGDGRLSPPLRRRGLEMLLAALGYRADLVAWALDAVGLPPAGPPPAR